MALSRPLVVYSISNLNNRGPRLHALPCTPALFSRDLGLQALTCLGGFQNARKVYDWQGYCIELDETKFEWGTLYELECETVSARLVVLGFGGFGF